jgi:hypothetical protein
LLPKAPTQCTAPRENVILEKAFLNLKQFWETKASSRMRMSIGGIAPDFAARKYVDGKI